MSLPLPGIITDTFLNPDYILHNPLMSSTNNVNIAIQYESAGHHQKSFFLIDSFLLNTLRTRQNGRHFTDDIFKRIFLYENIGISIKILLKFVPNDPINNIPALVQIMAWRRPGDKPLSETMLVILLTHICVTRPQWVKKWQHWQ